jgi:hypothetical protein
MILTENDWDNFWKFMERTNSYQVSLPNHHLFYITYNYQTKKIQFINDKTEQKGELAKENFKQLFETHQDYLDTYLKNSKLQGDLPADLYIANIIYDYFRWIA